MEKDLQCVLLTADVIRQRVEEIGRQITEEYHDKNPVIVALLRGAELFHADLIRTINCFMTVDFMVARSYGDEVVSCGTLTIKKELDEDVKGRHVIIVDDIFDSGLTLCKIQEYIMAKKPASLKFCVLLEKRVARDVSFKADIVGFEIEPGFVVGYGLDYAGKYRNLPYIGILKREVYEKK